MLQPDAQVLAQKEPELLLFWLQRERPAWLLLVWLPVFWLLPF